MDTVFQLDEEGTGTVSYYAFGNRYNCRVVKNVVEGVLSVERFDPLAHGQKLVNTRYANRRVNEVVEHIPMGGEKP